jgi:hypothetical protein
MRPLFFLRRRRLEKAFGPLPLDAIRPRHVAAYVAEKSEELGPATVGRDVSGLHAILRTAQREELVTAMLQRRLNGRSCRGGSGGSCNRRKSAGSLERSPTSRRARCSGRSS